MIIHRGRGGLIVIITIFCIFIADGLIESLYPNDGFYVQHPWPKLAGCLLAALVVRLLSPRQDPDSPQTASVETFMVPPRPSEIAPYTELKPPRRTLSFFRETDSLFFIPVKYWPILICIFGLFLYFAPNLPFSKL